MLRFGVHVLFLGILSLHPSLFVAANAASHDAGQANSASTTASSLSASPSASVVSSPPIPASVSSTSSHAPTTPTSASSTSSHSYTSPSLCPSRTINWITHTLPQQCLRTSRTPLAAESLERKDASFEGPWALRTDSGAIVGVYIVPTATATAGNISVAREASSHSATEASSSSSAGTASASGTETTSTAAESNTAAAEAESETDPLLDNANFLSFEDWKKQNLAKVGQSPDTVGQGRTSGGRDTRRRPPNIDHTLDSLGEDVEIELDFGGFGDAGKNGAAWSPQRTAETTDKPERPTDGVALGGRGRSKDAGKTCKERFNYASFDCAATVLKTNKQAKSTSSILVENKDSYLLNECSAENKFVIVELCDDILIDTLVLANFEFFSSMFRNFRISVSDRYPVKLERWKVLGTFEARNSRDIQAFLVEEPMIWARYLRIEFLNHYGTEFYCPVSLLRVHGTTMMEEFRHQEDVARGDDDDVEPIEEVATDVVVTATAAINVPVPTSDGEVHNESKSDGVRQETIVSPDDKSSVAHEQPSNPPQQNSGSESIVHVDKKQKEGAPTSQHESVPRTSTKTNSHASSTRTTTDSTSSVVQNGSTVIADENATAGPETSPKSSRKTTASSESSKHETSSSSAGASAAHSNTSTSASPSTSQSNTASQNQAQSQVQQSHNGHRAATAPPHPIPTTQESFFKSIHKRLQALESNSTLSLQYIEEQSRILRDAFAKVEKRQLQKTEKFLQHINETVVEELKGFRQMYDLLWQSTVLEVEGMKEAHGREMLAVSERLSILAEEVVWQKRMAVVQSTLLLLCLALVLFVKSGVGGGLEVPVVQHMMNQNWARGMAGRMGFESPSPPVSPPRGGWGVIGLRSSRSEIDLSRRLVSDTEGEVGDVEDQTTPEKPSQLTGLRLHLEPPSPPPTERGSREPSNSPTEKYHVIDRVVEVKSGTRSGPATPTGSRDRRARFQEDDDMENGDEMSPELVRVKRGSPKKSKMSSYSGRDVGESDTSGTTSNDDSDVGGVSSSAPSEVGIMDMDMAD